MEDGKWFSDRTEETKQGIAFTGSKLGIVPSGDGETIAIAYCDTDGVKQVKQIGPANVPVRVHGDIEMLAADDIASRYVVLVDEDATIDALFLGGIDPVSYTHLDVYKRQLLVVFVRKSEVLKLTRRWSLDTSARSRSSFSTWA